MCVCTVIQRWNIFEREKQKAKLNYLITVFQLLLYDKLSDLLHFIAEWCFIVTFLPADMAEAALYMCAYEFAIKTVNSPWCHLFDEVDAQVQPCLSMSHLYFLFKVNLCNTFLSDNGRNPKCPFWLKALVTLHC